MTKASCASPSALRLGGSTFGLLAILASVALGCDAGTGGSDEDNTGGTGAGTGGTGGSDPGTGGSDPGTGGTTTTGAPGFGTPNQVGSGSTTDRYHKTSVSRNGVNYFFMANGWGTNWQSHSLTWNGTAFTVVSLNGSQGSDYSPAGYPTMFCGHYSDSRSQQCGLPAAIGSITSLWTGWRWSPGSTPDTAQYNAAYDVWLSNSADVSGHSSFLMVWLRDPPGQQPAGANNHVVNVDGVPGTWDVWTGSVNGKPIVNYVPRANADDIYAIEFDVMRFINHAATEGYNLPGSHIISVAVGFEIWTGPGSNLVSEDFYVAVQ